MAGTADTIPDLTNLDKAAQLAALRRSMAAIPGRRDHAPTDSDDLPAFAPSQPNAQTAATDGDERALSGPVRSRTLKTLPVPMPLSELPHAARWPAERPCRSPVPDRFSSDSSPPPPRPATTSH